MKISKKKFQLNNIINYLFFSLSIIGIQEIGHKEALGYIIEELNNPTIPLIKDWPNRRQGKWKYTISDVCGRMFQVSFIYKLTRLFVL